MIGKSVCVYLDDTLIHKNHLRKAFDLMRKHKLYGKRSNFDLNMLQVQFLGHVVGGKGIQVDPKKVDAVVSWPTPNDVHEIRSFLGLTNYFC